MCQHDNVCIYTHVLFTFFYFVRLNGCLLLKGEGMGGFFSFTGPSPPFYEILEVEATQLHD